MLEKLKVKCFNSDIAIKLKNEIECVYAFELFQKYSNTVSMLSFW